MPRDNASQGPRLSIRGSRAQKVSYFELIFRPHIFFTGHNWADPLTYNVTSIPHCGFNFKQTQSIN